MPPALTASETSTKKPRGAKRPTSPSGEDELRLLGGPGEYDADAVSIEQPGRRRETNRMVGKPFSGGPRPRNTLATTNTLPRPRSVTYSRATDSFRKPLRTEVSRGDNVVMPFSVLPEDTYTGSPSAKRRKVVHLGSSSSSAISMDEAFESIPPEKIVMRAAEDISWHSSSQDRETDVPHRIKIPVGSTREFKGVERMMNSSTMPVKRNRSNGSFSHHDATKSTSPLLDAISRSTRSDMIMDDELDEVLPVNDKRSSYQDNGSSDAQWAEKRYRLKRTGETSHYFAKPPSPTRGSQAANEGLQARRDRPMSRPNQDTNMRNQFIQTNGLRRGGDVPSSSPDELGVVGNTIGRDYESVATTPGRKPHRESSSKDSSSTVKSKNIEAGLDPSNIRRTTWNSNHLSKRNATAQEADPPWSVRVTAVNLPGRTDMLKDDNFGLEYDEDSQSYLVQGGRLPPLSPRLRLIPKKLQKVLWEPDGCRMRFESSRSGNEDHVLELELASTKNVSDLLRRLGDSSAFRQCRKTSDHMSKVFEQRRRQEQRTMHEHSDAVLSAPSLLVRHLIDGGERSSAKGSVEMKSNTGAAKKLIHDLIVRAQDPQESTDLQPTHRTLRNTASQAPAETDSEGCRANKALSWLEKNKPAHNSHLRRSTRTSGISRNLTDIAMEDLEEPTIEKYSKTYGLGTKWSKPLTYPKDGKKKATVEWTDLERLDEGEFLNDNLVGFYLRYLQHELEQTRPELAKRIYIFNSFFYERLTTLPKGQKGINYLGVQKWTRAVDLFTYDYVIVPINEQFHWYLAIICNLPNLDRDFESLDEEPNHEPKAPAGHSDGIVRTGPSVSAEGFQKDSDVSAEEPAEKETTESFAGMSLDSNAKPVVLKDPDKGMLHSGKERLDSFKTIDATPLDVDDPIEDRDEKINSPLSSKRLKRKSLPPAVTHTDPKKPAIITFDSLGATHGVVIKALKHYLLEEARDKRGGMKVDITQIKGINAKNIPKQDNFSDCGPFMLGYVEKFLHDPMNFITKIIRRDEQDWSKLVPSDLRASIRVQLQDLHKIQRAEHREKAIKAGKYRTESSPVAPSAQPEEEQKRSIAVDKSRSHSSSPDRKPTTRAEALKEARGIDDLDSTSAVHEPRATNAADRRNDHYFPEAVQDESVIIVDSQSQAEPTTSSQPTVTVQDDAEPRSPILPAEIADSQPIVEIEPISREETIKTPPRDVIREAAGSIEEQTTLPRSTRKKAGRPRKTAIDVGVEEADGVINID